jgi:glucuronoarabinoxylan endo-1,4-beta-xylanase
LEGDVSVRHDAATKRAAGCLLLVAACLVSLSVAAQSGGIIVDFNDVRQRMDGFGASDRSVSALTDAQADLFFSPTSGIGLSMLRVGISQNGDKISAYSNATKAAARGAIVWGAPWSAPGAWKTNGTTTNGGHLLPAYYDAWASRLAGFASVLQQNAGVPLYGLSVQNEPDWTASWDSMLYTSQEMVDFIKVLGPKLAALNPRPKLIMPEVAGWYNAWGFSSAVLGDSTAAPYLDILAAHQYGGVSAPQTTARPIWQGEMSSFESFDPSIINGLGVARWIHDAIVTGNASAWHYWWLIGANLDNEGLIGYNRNTTPTKRLYTVGNFSKFVRPGFVRVGSSAAPGAVSLTAYKNPSTGAFVIVAINQGGDVPVTVTLNGLTAGSVTPWVTSASLDLAQQPAVAVSGGSFTTTLPVYSVTSFVGTSQSVSQPPSTPASPNPANGASGVSVNQTLTWSALGATSYDVQFGASNPPPTVAVNQSNASYAPGTLNAGTTYYWQIIARNANGNTSGPIWTFTTGSGSQTSYALVAHRVDSLGPNGGTGGLLDTTGADILFVLEAFNNGGAGTLTDSKGNTWSQLTKQGTAGSGATVLWYAKNAIVGPGHRFTITGTNTYSAIAVAAFSGSDLTLPFDVQSGHSMSNSPTDQPGSVTPGAANALVITGLEFNSGPVSVDSGVTILDQAPLSGGQYFGVALGYSIQSAAAAVNPTWRQATSGQLATVTATFRPGQSVGPPAPPLAPTSPNPVSGASSVSATPTLTWSATGATSYDVRFGASNPPPTVAVNQSNASYAPGTLNAGTTYYWQIVARNANGNTSGPIWTFTTGSGSAGSGSYALIAHRVDPLGPNGGTGGTLDTSGADILFVLEGYGNNSGPGTLSDNKGNTWSQLTKQGTGGSGATVLWYAKNAIVGPGHRFTITGNSTYSAIAVAAFSGSDLTSPFDVQSGHSLSNSPTDQPGSVTPGAANALVITGLEFTSAPPVSVDSGVTILDQTPLSGGQYYGVALGYSIQSAAAAVNPTWRQTTSGQLASVMATFRPGQSVGPPAPPSSPTSPGPANGASGVSATPTLTWSAAGATSYDVQFGASNPPPTVAVNQSIASYAPGTLTAGTAYYWQIVARNASGATTGPIWTFTTGSGSAASYALIAHRVDSLGPNGGTGMSLNTTGANILFVLEAYGNNSPGTLTDSKGNTWSQLTKQGNGGSGATVLWYAKNAIVGSGHTFTITGNNTYSAIAVAAFSGGNIASPFDTQNGHSLSNSAMIQPGTVTPGAANALVITGLEFTSAPPVSVDSGVTILDQTPLSGGQYFGVALGYIIQTAAAPINPIWRQTTSGQLASIVATFK